MLLHHGLAEEEAARYALGLAHRRQIQLSWERAMIIARAVEGHPLLVEQLVAQARRRDLDELLEEVAKKQGDFAARIKTVYAWSAARLDESGRAAWADLPLFSAGCAPEGVLKAAAGQEGPGKLREAALADFDPAGQVWRWHGTVAEYARGHWPLSQEEQRSRMIALLPAWTQWLRRLGSGKGAAYSKLEMFHPNLEAEVKVSPIASYEEAWAFLDELDAHLPLPERTLILREMAAEVWKTKLLILPPGEEVRRAGLLNNLGTALSYLGRRDEALSAAQEAADIYRKLAEDNAQAFLPDLAMSLNNLGNRLSYLGRRDEALSAAQEAADIYRKLAEDNAQAFLPDLAASLNNLGMMLSDLGRREEALSAAQEAADIYRKLAWDNAQAFLPDLARSLGAYGRVLLALERHDEAAIAFLEGLQHLVPFYRKLPQAFTGLVNTLRQFYLEACQKAELKPDRDLLSRFE